MSVEEPIVHPSQCDRQLVPLLHSRSLLVGVVHTLLGPILPMLASRWRLDDAKAGSLFIAQFTGAMMGSALSGSMIERLESLRPQFPLRTQRRSIDELTARVSNREHEKKTVDEAASGEMPRNWRRSDASRRASENSALPRRHPRTTSVPSKWSDSLKSGTSTAKEVNESSFDRNRRYTVASRAAGEYGSGLEPIVKNCLIT